MAELSSRYNWPGNRSSIYNSDNRYYIKPEEFESACKALGKPGSPRMWVVPCSKLGDVYRLVETEREVKRLQELQAKQEEIAVKTKEKIQKTMAELEAAKAKLDNISGELQ